MRQTATPIGPVEREQRLASGRRIIWFTCEGYCTRRPPATWDPVRRESRSGVPASVRVRSRRSHTDLPSARWLVGRWHVHSRFTPTHSRRFGEVAVCLRRIRRAHVGASLTSPRLAKAEASCSDLSRVLPMTASYFARLTAETPTRVWVNNPTIEEMDLALAQGAVGCTTNPGYSGNLLKRAPNQVSSIIADCVRLSEDDSDVADRVQQRLVARIVERFRPLYRRIGRALWLRQHPGRTRS